MDLDLPGAAKAVEVVDVGAPHRGLQRAEDTADRNPQGLGALAIQFKVDLRRRGAEGGVDAGERRVLVGGNDETVGDGREISRFCAGEALQLEFEPGGISEAGDWRHIEGNDIGGGDLPECPIEFRQCREDRE